MPVAAVRYPKTTPEVTASVPSVMIWIDVLLPRTKSPNPSGITIAASTAPRSRRSSRLSSRPVPARSNTPLPSRASANILLSDDMSLSRKATVARGTSVVTAYPNTRVWRTGTTKITVRIRGSRNAWVSSLRMIARSLGDAISRASV